MEGLGQRQRHRQGHRLRQGEEQEQRVRVRQGQEQEQRVRAIVGGACGGRGEGVVEGAKHAAAVSGPGCDGCSSNVGPVVMAVADRSQVDTRAVT